MRLAVLLVFIYIICGIPFAEIDSAAINDIYLDYYTEGIR